MLPMLAGMAGTIGVVATGGHPACPGGPARDSTETRGTSAFRPLPHPGPRPSVFRVTLVQLRTYCACKQRGVDGSGFAQSNARKPLGLLAFWGM